MNKQPDMVFALYYRAARTNDNDTTLHLDNQMHQLLQYARQHGIDNFALYVDMGYPGATPDRPAFKEMLSTIHSGHMQAVVTHSTTRIARDSISLYQFLEDAARHGTAVFSIKEGGDLLAEHKAFAAIRSLMKGGVLK